jgi:hypothetical protein
MRRFACEYKYSILDNWLLLSSIPNFLYCTFSFELVQAAVRFSESCTICSGGGQTGFFLFPAKTHDEGVHADVTTQGVVKRQVQGTRQTQKHLKRFFFGVRVRTQKCLISWDCEAHRPSSFFDEVTR